MSDTVNRTIIQQHKDDIAERMNELSDEIKELVNKHGIYDPDDTERSLKIDTLTYLRGGWNALNKL